MDRNEVIYVRGISREAKQGFKSLCARHGLTMTQGIEILLRLASDDEKWIRHAAKIEQN